MEQYTSWSDFLVAEHELIERSMAVLKRCLEKIDDTVRDPVQAMRALDFLMEFGDKIHNRKEENVLFPLMEKRGIPVVGGPLGVMLKEHEAERQLLGKMLTAAPVLAAAPAADLSKFTAEGMAYLEVRAEHIWKENDILYPMGRQVMNEADNKYLLQEFALINTTAYGPDAVQQFGRMVAELEEGGKAEDRMIRRLSYEQLDAIMEAMPFEITFVDAEDTVAYFNRLDKKKIFPRTRSVIGRKVEKCHPEKSVDTVRKIVDGFKNGTLDKAEFWIDFSNDKVLIRYFPVYAETGDYMGVLEVTQAIGDLQKLKGQKRLLD